MARLWPSRQYVLLFCETVILLVFDCGLVTLILIECIRCVKSLTCTIVAVHVARTRRTPSFRCQILFWGVTQSNCRNENSSGSDTNEEKKKSHKKFKEVVGTSNRASSPPNPPDDPSKPDFSSFPSSSEVVSTTPEIPSSEPKPPGPRSNQQVMEYIFGLHTRWEDQFNKLLACFDKLSSSLNPG